MGAATVSPGHGAQYAISWDLVSLSFVLSALHQQKVLRDGFREGSFFPSDGCGKGTILDFGFSRHLRRDRRLPAIGNFDCRFFDETFRLLQYQRSFLDSSLASGPA